MTAHGTIFFNGYRHVILTDGGTSADEFIAYLKILLKEYHRVVLNVDQARTHTAKKVKEVLKRNKNMALIYLPKGSPHLNVIEKLWDLVKHTVLTSEYYSMFDDM